MTVEQPLPATDFLSQKKMCWLYPRLTKFFGSVQEAAVVEGIKMHLRVKVSLKKKTKHTSNSSCWSPKSLSPKS